MDDQELFFDPTLAERDAAPDPDAEEDSPSPDEAPDDDRDDDADDDDLDAEPPEDDPSAELERLRQDMRERDRRDRERAEQDAAERLRQQQAQEQATQQQRQRDKQQARATYQHKRNQQLAGIAADFELAEKSGDPRGLFAERIQLRRAELDRIDAEYEYWKDQYDAGERWQMQQALQRASTREYADHVRQAYGLPHDSINEIVAYRDGTPVDINAFAARAAEIAERRKDDANRKRQQTRAQREQARDERRGKTNAAPGRGRAPLGQEIEGTLEEARAFWTRRAS